MAADRHLRAIEGNRESRERLRRAPLPSLPDPTALLGLGRQRVADFWTRATELAGDYGPQAMAALATEVDRSLAALALETNEIGRDRFGFAPSDARHPLYASAFLYRYWFRTGVDGLENLPAGRCILVANHGGHLPFDACMLQAACLLDGEPARLPRLLHPRAWNRTPMFAAAAARLGGQSFTQHNARQLLTRDQAVAVFPEGPAALGKPLRERYRLRPFQSGFLRAALATDAPVVPVAIVGSEEQIPALASFPSAAAKLGLPALPITPTFPLLGAAGLVPLPVRYRIRIGTPLQVRGNPTDPADAFSRRAETVRSEVATLLDQLLEQRESFFA